MNCNFKLIIIPALLVSLMDCSEQSSEPETENQAPTIQFTSPSNNSVFMRGEAITFTVEVNDPEEDIKEVRFYLNNVGLESDQNWPFSFDLETSTLDEGVYTIKAEAIDNDNANGDAEINVNIESNNPPVASFAVNPRMGNKSEFFSFDASSSSDIEDSIDELLIRWDWESDGDWDTEYSTNKIITHQFSVDGTSTVKLEVKDTGGLSSYISESVTIYTIVHGTGVTDIDGNNYETVIIGDQEWIAENLKVTRFRNGDLIPTGFSNTDWINLDDTGTGAYAIYDDNAHDEVDKYGALYNWYAVSDSRKIAPDGWHVPTNVEWQIMVDYLGGYNEAGGKLRESDTTHWEAPNTGATNESGFTALPGGYRSGNSFGSGDYYDMGSMAWFWSSTAINSQEAWRRVLPNNAPLVQDFGGGMSFGHSVRLVKD